MFFFFFFFLILTFYLLVSFFLLLYSSVISQIFFPSEATLKIWNRLIRPTHSSGVVLEGKTNTYNSRIVRTDLDKGITLK